MSRKRIISEGEAWLEAGVDELPRRAPELDKEDDRRYWRRLRQSHNCRAMVDSAHPAIVATLASNQLSDKQQAQALPSP